ncbi:hypothetical protein [Frankia nepalensis]|uniref:hypothetical protein n=1 Tax=Frankia nepalensis TaxID=1836974 RepID=UPI001EE3AC49|nr:hypothetical protein [Frankia nepalensis]
MSSPARPPSARHDPRQNPPTDPAGGLAGAADGGLADGRLGWPDDGMARRLKALALTQPLHDLDARKRLLDGADLSVYAMAELALHAIDLVTVAMDFDRGASHDQVLRRLTPLAAAQAPRRPATEHERVARWVLDNLINVGSVDRGFDAVYGTYHPDGRYERRRFDFKLLVELADPAGEIYLRATDEAVTVLVGALDTDVTSAQVAAEVTLDNLIRRGRLSDARAAAEAARYRTVQYAEQLRRSLEGTRRDVLSVDWLHTVPALVDEALGHVEARYRHENAILTHIRRYRDSAADPARKRAAADLVTIVADCVRRHTQLQARLLEAFAVFRAEQDRQQFAPPAAGGGTGVDLYTQLLAPTLARPAGEAARVAGAFFGGAVGVRAPRAPRLADLVDALLRPPVERDPLGAPIPEAELSTWEEPARFGDDAWTIALDLLDELDPDAPRRLSGLLAAARERGAGEPVATEAAQLLVLLALHAVSPRLAAAHRRGDAAAQGAGAPAAPGAQGPAPDTPGERVLLAVDDGTPLDDPEFGGADLLVGRVVVTARPAPVDARGAVGADAAEADAAEADAAEADAAEAEAARAGAELVGTR